MQNALCLEIVGDVFPDPVSQYECVHGDFSSLAWRVNLCFGTLAALFAYLLADQELLNYFVVVLAKLVIKMSC